MNNDLALFEIIRRLDEYKEKVLLVNDFLDDLKGLIKKELKGQEKAFKVALIKQLVYINELSPNELAHADHNEVLMNTGDERLYSLHLSSKVFNLRILGTYYEDKFVFLHIFYERKGKRSTDYTKAISIALERYNSIKEEE